MVPAFRCRPVCAPLITALIAGTLLSSCGSSGGSAATPSKWRAIRAAAAPELALTTVFATPEIQPLAVDGWEDGIFISRDGLHLFAVYAPADLLSFTIAGADQNHAADFLRGPTYGMDLHTNPAATTTWIHGDIIHATRTSTTHAFSHWHLSATARPVTSEGAVVTQGTGGGTWDLFVYTSNDHAPDYKAHICLLHDAPIEPPNAAATFLPAPVTTSTTEDNPHVERLDATHLVLFFDSDDRPGGTGTTGLHDIWYTTSADDGVTWAAPAALTSVNTALEDEQPHLFHSSTGTWWLYFSATNPADGKLGIFRCAQGTPGDWNSWGTRELVIGAGNTVGVGEPTLTAAGDLSFVAVIEDTATGTATNRYDADPWFAPHLPSAIVKPTTTHDHALRLTGGIPRRARGGVAAAAALSVLPTAFPAR
jgi:hypothetical protein